MLSKIWSSSIRFFLFKVLGKKRIIAHLLDDEEKKALYYAKNGYLQKVGWFNSYKNQQPLDGSNNPIPWVTYPFLDFIGERIKSGFTIFEYGSGNSTLYFSKKVESLVTVEHDKEWFNQLKETVPNNVKLIYEPLEYGGRYADTANRVKQKFHVVIVDGRDRVNCCLRSVSALCQDGVIVLDDSERPQYKSALETLQEKKFYRIDFWGIAPGVSHKKCTSIFYKNENCLDM